MLPIEHGTMTVGCSRIHSSLGQGPHTWLHLTIMVRKLKYDEQKLLKKVDFLVVRPLVLPQIQFH